LCQASVRAARCGNEFVNRAVNFVLALCFEQAAGDADGDGTSMGISASKVEYDSAAARVGQRLRTKLFPTSTQKCANRSRRLNSFSAPVCAPARILMSRKIDFFAMIVAATLTKPRAKSTARESASLKSSAINPLYRAAKIRTMAVAHP
jgi:hypothetical protein